MIPPSLLVLSSGMGLIDLPLRAAFSPAHPLARRGVPLARARGVRDRALREHRGSSGSIPPLFREQEDNQATLFFRLPLSIPLSTQNREW